MIKRKNPIFVGAPLWIVTFADLSTLMLTFFVLLLSFANTDLIKFKEMLGSVQGAFGVKVKRQGEFQDTLSGEGTVESEKEKTRLDEKVKIRRQLEKVNTIIKEAVGESEMAGDMETISQGTATLIRVKGEALFPSGLTKINPKAVPFLNTLAEVLKKTKFNIKIEGHTDNVPVKVGEDSVYKSNWEISGARAAVVVRYLISKKVNPEQLAAVGYGHISPIATNDTPEGRAKNRRVEFLIHKR